MEKTMTHPDQGTLEWLDQRAQWAPDEIVLRYVHGDGQPDRELSAGQWQRQALQVAAWLRERGAPGERVLLAHGPGLDFLIGLYGCLYAGLIAVPAYPPKQTRHGVRLQAVLQDSGARLALADAAGTAALRRVAEGPGLWAQLQTLDQSQPLALEPLAPRLRAQPRPQDLAYLQYTSGSTADPKGVMVTHGSLAHNLGLMREAFEGGPDMVMVSWLPLFHDMGLVLGAMLPLFCRGRCVLMAPNEFVQRPRLWLEAMTKHKGTHSAAPDFAYRRCVEKVPPAELQGLDLSAWRVAVNGAEPVRAATLRAFSDAMAVCGFASGAFRPAYGLAEGTLYVSHARWDGSPGPVDCGQALGQDLRLVDPQSLEPCAPGAVGEIWVRGGSVCGGYWGREALSEAVFRATCEGVSGYLRTGDLGRQADGGLRVQGRLKDLVILRGANHHPEDLEESARLAAGVGAGAAAAFALESGEGESLVLVQELPRARKAEAAGVAEAIAEALAQGHGVEAERILIVGPGQVPRTSSGKVQRRACQRDWLDGVLRVWHERAQEGSSAERPMDSLRQAEAQARQASARRKLGGEGPRPLPDRWVPGVAQVLTATGGQSGPAVAPPQPDPVQALPWREPAHPALAALWAAVEPLADSSAYHIAWSLRLAQLPDLARLRLALQDLLRSQPRLGSAFRLDEQGQLWSEGGGPLPALEQPFDQGQAPAQSEAWLRRWAAQPMALDQAPLWRWAFVPLAGGGGDLAFCFHHLIFDQRSWQAFHAFLQDPSAGLNAAPQPLLSVADAERSRDYWRHTLMGARPSRLIPQPSGQSARLEARVPDALVLAVRRVAARQRVTPFVAVAAAWGAALSQLSGAEHALFAIPSTLRAQPLSDERLGYFVQPMPLLLARCQDGPEQALQQADAALRGALDHRGLTLGPALRQGGLGLPEAFLVYQGEMPTGLHVMGQSAELHPIQVDGLKAPLALELSGEESWDLALSYDRALDPSQAARLLAAFQQSLAQLSGWREDAAQRPALLRSEAAVPGLRRSVVDGFHQQVSLCASADALRWDGGRLSYGELAEQVRSVARSLDQAGVLPGQRIAVMASAGPEWVAAMLGCFELGAVYVPLDPAYPHDRVRAMLATAPCALALVEGPPPPSLDGVPVLDLGAAVHARPPYLRRPGRPSPEEPAYLIFTSGSSGTPKGVQVSHRALLNHAEGYAQRLGLGEGDRVLQFVSISFDPSLEEVLPSLLSGACVVLSRRRGALAVHELEKLLQDHAATVLHLPAAYWHAWMAAGGEAALARLDSVRALVSGGEAPEPRWVEALLRATQGRCRYFNAYGPTEACISTSLYECSRASAVPTQLPLGRPLPGMALAVVGPDGRLLGGESEGELWISGPQLADAHWIGGNADQSAFCLAALEPGEPKRWYRSGDRVRWQAGVGLLHRGRMDRQLKIAGHRLDPEEVEHLLQACPGVAQAVVDLRHEGGQDRLLAWVVPVPGAVPQTQALREALAQRLPGACIPQSIHTVEAFPLTPNGKLDRAALVAGAGPATAAAAPLDGVLAALCRAWAHCLGAKDCGPDADFFELGGSSLSAVRLAAEAGKACGRPVDLDLVLRAVTPRRLLQMLGEGQSAAQPLQDLGGKGPAHWVLFPPVSGRLDCYRPLAAALAPTTRVLGVDLGALTPDTGSRWQGWVQACAQLILQAAPEGPLALGGWSMGGLLATDVALALQARGRKVDRLALIDSLLPDPVESALLREDPTVLDPVFDRDLAALKGAPEDAGPLRERFKDHAVALADFQPRPLTLPLSLIVSERSARERPQASWMAWALLAREGMTTLLLPGDHYAVMDKAAAARLGHRLNREAGLGFQGRPLTFAGKEA